MILREGVARCSRLAADSNPTEDTTSKDANPKEDATSKDANPKGLESMSVPMLNVGLGALVACAGLATMLSELSADIKLNHSVLRAEIDTNHKVLTNKMDANHKEVTTKIETTEASIRAEIDTNHKVLTNKIDANHKEVTTKIDNGTEIFELKLKNLKLENSVSELTHDKIVKPTSKQ